MAPDPKEATCIAVWTPFIKALGQHRTMEVGKWIKERDRSHAVNFASGGKSTRILADLKRLGTAAGVYTQTTDVEGEVNGPMTYDRAVIKIPADELREIDRVLNVAP